MIYFFRNYVLVQSQQQKHKKKVWNMFEVNNKNHQNEVVDVVLVFLLLTLNIFYTLSTVDFEQVNVS